MLEVFCMGFGVPFPHRLDVTRSDQSPGETFVIVDQATVSNIFALASELPDANKGQRMSLSGLAYVVRFSADKRERIVGTVWPSIACFGANEWMDDPSGKMWNLIKSADHHSMKRS